MSFLLSNFKELSFAALIAVNGGCSGYVNNNSSSSFNCKGVGICPPGLILPPPISNPNEIGVYIQPEKPKSPWQLSPESIIPATSCPTPHVLKPYN